MNVDYLKTFVDNETKANEAFRFVTFLLPMKLYFRKRPPAQKIMWTEF